MVVDTTDMPELPLRHGAVIHLLPQDAWGGAETAARSAAESDALRCDLIVMFLSGRTLANNRARIVDHPKRSLNNPLSYISAVREIVHADPELLICSLWRSVLVGIFVKILRRQTAFVCFLHNIVAEHVVDRIVHWAAIRLADEIWADSPATLEARLDRQCTSVRTISFVSERRQPGTRPRIAPRFVNWTRLHAQKGHDRAIRVVASLAELGIDARLEIWGADNGDGLELKELAEQLGVAERISFPGVIERGDIAELAFRNTFYLQLSRYEGMAMAVVEAMQLGLVPIVTPVGQMAEYVRHGVNGLVVDASKPAKAAASIAKVLADPDQVTSMAKEAARTWASAPLYAENFCQAALALTGRQPKGRP
jgi:glycosyltransferase involved in cell wall biosynthesis